MLHKIKQLIEAVNPDYHVFYEDNYMMNIKADEKNAESRLAQIEEFREGQYVSGKYGGKKLSMKMQIYFFGFTQMHSDAVTREELRDEINSEMIQPFIAAYERQALFDSVPSWRIYYPFPRYDANETGILLEFVCSQSIC